VEGPEVVKGGGEAFAGAPRERLLEVGDDPYTVEQMLVEGGEKG
jgi:hypothetical protein